MGTPGSGGYESPQHSVHLDGYWLGRTEVTRGEYRQFIEAGGYQSPSYWTGAGWAWRAQNSRTQPSYWADTQTWNGNTFTQTDQHPVAGVTYYEAEAFCKWAGGRLPTEAEWEKAARWDGAASREYPWGNEWNPGFCNNWEDTSILGGGYKKYQTAPVTSYPLGMSPYGLHDMAGNVWEWCSDWYGSTYYSQTPAGGWVNPKGPSSGSNRLLRGGSFDVVSSVCRAAYRSSDAPSYSDVSGGFRVAR